MTPTVESLVQEHAEAKSVRHKAMLEARIWGLVPGPQRKGWKRRDYLAQLLHVSSSVVHRRESILQAPDVLWDRVDDGSMTLPTAGRLWLQARRVAKTSRIPVDQAMTQALTEYDALPLRRTPGGQTYRAATPGARRLAGSAPKKAPPKQVWLRIREEIAHLVARDAQSVDDFTRSQLLAGLERDLQSLIREFGNRVQRAREVATSPATLVTRRQVTTACQVLAMDPPVPGQPADLTYAGRQKRKLARLYHPDLAGPDASAEYDRVLQSYATLEAYTDQVKGFKHERVQPNANPGNHSEEP